jgi:hypothetical protein
MLVRGSLFLLIALAILVTAACASPTAKDAPPASVSPLLLDFREKLDEDPTRCAHAWQQVGMHAWTRDVNGMPSVDLCSVLRCAKCGEERHECSRRRR